MSVRASARLERIAPRAALGVTLLALLLRVRGLGTYWLNPDEGIYYSTLTHESFSRFWAEVVTNAHPPAYYLLLRGAAFVTWDFVALRGLTALCGTLAVWGLWLVGRELAGRGAAGAVSGLVCAALVAINPDLIALSQVLRPYMLLLALLAFALYHLLRYRTEPETRSLAGYAGLTCLALLTHYSAALALGVFWLLVASWGFRRESRTPAWWRLVAMQILPAMGLTVLYLQHLGAAVESDLVRDALTANGWLSMWLVSSPFDAWRSFLGFQILVLPEPLQGRSAILVAGALLIAGTSRDRTALLLGAGALAVAIFASAVGLYPFGPTRHDTWLVLFIVAVLGSVTGGLATSGAHRLRAVVGGCALFLLVATPVEGWLSAGMNTTNVSEERVLRREDLAPLVASSLASEGSPSVIVMSEQPFNLLMPLLAIERNAAVFAPDSTSWRFAYGSRDVVVTRGWDWPSPQALRDQLDAALRPDEETILLVAGGWGSGLFPSVIELQRRGAFADPRVALGRALDGEPLMRMLATRVDRPALDALR